MLNKLLKRFAPRPSSPSPDRPLSQAETRQIRSAIRSAYSTHLHRRARSHEIDHYFNLVADGAVSLPNAIAAIAASPEAEAARTRASRDYAMWIKTCDTLTEADCSSIRRHIARFSSAPKISLVMTVGSVDASLLTETIASVRNQLYGNWQLAMAGVVNLPPESGEVMQEAAENDDRIICLHAEAAESGKKFHRRMLDALSGEFVAVLHEGDLLSPAALYEVVNMLLTCDADVVYSDHDLVSEAGIRHAPNFKTGWNLDMFLERDCIGDLAVFRRSAIEKTGGLGGGQRDAASRDLAARVITETSDERIRHVPAILYHRRSRGRLYTDGLVPTNGSMPLHGELREKMLHAKGRYAVSENGTTVLCDPRHASPDGPLVTIIIPTRNRCDLLRVCVESILHHTRYRRYEILIIDHENTEAATLEFFRELAADRRVRLLPFGGPFNFSAMNNEAVAAALGEIIVFLNNDTEVINSEWLDQLVVLARCPRVGAVGALLMFPNDTIQHAGVVLGLSGVAGHVLVGSTHACGYQQNRLETPSTVSAVTAACMALRKVVFAELGGFNSKDLAVAYNDIDLCLKIREAGYQNVWTPHAVLYHHESPSRGADDDPTQLARWQGERDYMMATWGAHLADDPYYNVNLALDTPTCDLAFPPRRLKPWQES